MYSTLISNHPPFSKLVRLPILFEHSHSRDLERSTLSTTSITVDTRAISSMLWAPSDASYFRNILYQPRRYHQHYSHIIKGIGIGTLCMAKYGDPDVVSHLSGHSPKTPWGGTT